MTGMSAHTGRHLELDAHIRQSVRDILTTPIGSRVMRREYGSLLPELVDQPLNNATLLRVYAAAAIAIMRWETRIRLQRISVSTLGQGELVVDLDFTQGRQGQRLSVPLGLKGALA